MAKKNTLSLQAYAEKVLSIVLGEKRFFPMNPIDGRKSVYSPITVSQHIYYNNSPGNPTGNSSTFLEQSFPETFQ